MNYPQFILVLGLVPSECHNTPRIRRFFEDRGIPLEEEPHNTELAATLSSAPATLAGESRVGKPTLYWKDEEGVLHRLVRPSDMELDTLLRVPILPD